MAIKTKLKPKDPKPKDKDTGKPFADPYMEGWFAGMEDGETEACSASDNPYPPGHIHDRWQLGYEAGKEEDKDNVRNGSDEDE